MSFDELDFFIFREVLFSKELSSHNIKYFYIEWLQYASEYKTISFEYILQNIKFSRFHRNKNMKNNIKN